MPITFGNLDPYRKHRQLEQLRDVGMMFVEMSSRKKAEEERKRQAEVARALEMLNRYPEVVDQPAGEDLARKFPELAPIVSVVRDRTKLLGQVNQAGESWLGGADQLAKEHQESLQRKMFLAAPHSPFAPPNLQAFGSLVQESQVHPDSFLQESAESLSPSERIAANIWGRERGLKVPEPQYMRRFDPMRDLTQKGRGMLAAETGQLPPETAQSQRVQANMAEGAREKLKRDMDAARDRRAAIAAEISRRGQDLRSRALDLQEGKTTGQGRRGAGYKSARSFLKDSYDTYLDNLKKKQKAWDAELEEAQKEVSGTIGKNAAEDALVERIGPRPAVPDKMLPGHMNRITDEVLAEGSTPPEDPDLAANWKPATPQEIEQVLQAAADHFARLLSRGIPQDQAVRIILGEEDEPPLEAERQFLSRGGVDGR